MFKKILVPLDGSKIAEKALDYVRPVAGESAMLYLLSVVSPVITGKDEVFDLDKRLSATLAYLEGISLRMQIQGLRTRTLVLSGEPAGEILRLIAGEAMELVVMNSHIRSDRDANFIGSVAERVCRQAACPALVVGMTSLSARERVLRSGARSRFETAPSAMFGTYPPS
jgi:nucleotide-binding universal stress UspA family protein